VSELSLGSVLPHRFVIEKRMQSGGLGLIVRAGNRQTNRDVARKLRQGESQSASYGLLAQARRRRFGIMLRSRVAQAVSGKQVQRVSEFLGELQTRINNQAAGNALSLEETMRPSNR